MASTPFSPTEPLNARYGLDDFDCGQPQLNLWLQKYALANQRNDSSKTRVVSDDQGKVVGYYSLAAGGVEYEEAPVRVGHGLARHPIPIVVLTRLAVDKRMQRRGLGRVLLRDALKMVADVSDTVGVRALLIHAKTEGAREWYLHRAEFESVPGMPNKLFLLIKDLRAAAEKGNLLSSPPPTAAAGTPPRWPPHPRSRPR